MRAVNEARFRDAEARLWASIGTTPTERRVTLPSTGVSVRVQELGDGPPILFVHGASNSGTSWANLAARLPEYRCVLLDRPGCGLSDRLGVSFDDVEQLGAFADALIVDVLDALGDDTANVVATSFGGYIALRSTAAHPDRVTRAVQFSWPAGAPIRKTPFAMRLTSIRVLGRIMASIPPNERAVRAILRQIGLGGALKSGAFTQEMVDWFVSLLRDTNTMRNEVDAGPRVVTPLHGMNDEILLGDGVLGRIRVPTLFCWGADDPMGGAETARAFTARVPGAELDVMTGAGHAPWIDDAEHAAAQIRAWFGGGSSGER